MTENPNPIIIIEIEYIANDERFEPIMEKVGQIAWLRGTARLKADPIASFSKQHSEVSC